jgi:hypothetical protein
MADDTPDTELMRRGVTNARSHHHRGRHQRWVAVMEVFGCPYERRSSCAGAST